MQNEIEAVHINMEKRIKERRKRILEPDEREKEREAYDAQGKERNLRMREDN